MATHQIDQVDQQRRPESGFTLIELLIALSVLLIGLAGLMMVQIKTVRSGTYARRSTEAAVLAEKKMEELRTIALTSVVDGADTVDAQGEPAAGPFSRVWTIQGGGSMRTIEVTVSWEETMNGNASRTVSTVLQARRAAQ